MSVVYFIQSGDGGPIKIGRGDALERLSALQCGNPVDLTLLGTIPGTSDLEAALHREFRQHRVIREWFAPEPVLALLCDLESVGGDRREAVDAWLKAQRDKRASAAHAACGHSRAGLAAGMKEAMRIYGAKTLGALIGASEATVRNAAAGRCILSGPALATAVTFSPSGFQGIFSNAGDTESFLREARSSLDVLIDRARFAA